MGTACHRHVLNSAGKFPALRKKFLSRLQLFLNAGEQTPKVFEQTPTFS
jgi:hypothetical protein